MSAHRRRQPRGVVQNPPLPFELSERQLPSEPAVRRLQHPVWTESKAKLVERYLYYFVLVTKHGTYLDGFAGPQEPDRPEMWSAKLVLESEPRRLRHFYLYDNSYIQVRRLRALVESQAPVPGRTVEVVHADFNAEIGELLRRSGIGPNEATFCLLDQRTFECHWATVQALANYKEQGRLKIELFYFLAVGWLHRAFSGVRNSNLIINWWGAEDWAEIRILSPEEIKDRFVDRFTSELGYLSAKAWPIYSRVGSNSVMYYMIHATDHPAAPELMARAYNDAVRQIDTTEQFSLFDDGANRA